MGAARPGRRGTAWDANQAQGQPTELRVGTRGGPVPAAWFSIAAVEPEPRRRSSVSRSPLVIAAQTQRLHLSRTLQSVPLGLQERLQGSPVSAPEVLQRSRSPPRRRLTPTPAADGAARDRELSDRAGFRSGAERVQARLPALLSLMQAGNSVLSGRRSTGAMQAFASRDQDNARQGRIVYRT